jgi:hypothetical protein
MTDLESALARIGDTVYWHSDKDKFYLATPYYPWIPLKLELLKVHLAQRGFFDCVTNFEVVKNTDGVIDKKKTNDNKMLAGDRLFTQFVSRIREENVIVWTGDLAGLESGFHIQNGFPFLVIQGMRLPVPVEGECGFILQILEELFSDEERQYVMAWLQHGYLSFKRHEASFSQALIVAGESQDGKSLFQTQIISGLFGGRAGDASHHFSDKGNNNFNQELARAEHWMVDDKTGGAHFDRTAWGERLKKFTAVPAMRIEAKGMNALNLILNRRLSVVMNTGSHNLALLPPDTDDLRDKIILVKSRKVKCLLPTVQENNALIASQMSAFAWHMEQAYKAPAEVVGDPRFWVRAYQNEELADERRATSTAYHIENLIEGYMQTLEMPEWKGTCQQLYTALDHYDRSQFSTLIKHPNQLGINLTELVKSGNSIVKTKVRSNKSTVYTVETTVEQQTGVRGAKVIPGAF